MRLASLATRPAHVLVLVGLALFGLGSGLMVQSDLGNPPWDVFHEGLALSSPLSIGVAAIVTSFGVLLYYLVTGRFPASPRTSLPSQPTQHHQQSLQSLPQVRGDGAPAKLQASECTFAPQHQGQDQQRAGHQR